MAKQNKENIVQKYLLSIFIAFICGFIAGVIFTVFKMDQMQTLTPAETANVSQQENISQQQIETIKNLQTKVANAPNDYQSWTRLGHLYFDTNQFQKAIEAYKKSLELHEGSADLHTDLGIMYRKVNNPQKAVEHFDTAAQLDPKHVFSRLNKGIILYNDLNQPQQAVEIWEEVLSIDPETRIGDGLLLRDALQQIKKEIKKKE